MRRPAPLLSLIIGAAPAESATGGNFDLWPGVALESGDSWIEGGTRSRLFGVQACLRGRSYTDKFDARRESGEASLNVLAARISDAKPPHARLAPSGDTILISRFVVIGSDRLVIANLTISSGFVFASLDGNRLPHHLPYALAGQTARENGAGRWQFFDAQHPAVLLGQSASQRKMAR